MGLLREPRVRCPASSGRGAHAREDYAQMAQQHNRYADANGAKEDGIPEHP